MDDGLLASHVEAIYGLPREDFTTERDRRVKELRAAGHRDEAAALKVQRKPTVPAWAVNQAVRRHPDAVGALLAAAEELRQTQRRAASGRGSKGLREAGRQLREAAASLRERARVILQEAGVRPDQHLDEVEQTLFSAAVDPTHHERLRNGLFDSPLGGTGFGSVEALLLVPGPPDDEEPPEDDAAAGSDEDARRQEARERAARAEALRARLRDLMLDRERQQRRVERTEEKVADLKARLREAAGDEEDERRELGRLDDELAALRSELAELEA